MVPLSTVSDILFAAVAIVVAVMTYRRPAYGIAALLLLDPFDYSHALGPTTITFPKVALLGFIAGLVARRTPLRPLPAPGVRAIGVGALAIVGATALAATQADFPTPALREVLKALEYAALFGATLVAFASDGEERVVDAALIAVTLVVALGALTQALNGTAPSALYLGGRVIPRIAGPLEGPNQLAGFFDVAIPSLLALLFTRGRVNIVLIAALVLASCAEVLTFSRAGLVALLASAAIVIAIARPSWGTRRTIAALGLVAFAVLGVLAAAGMLARFTSFDDAYRPTGLGSRSELWRAALDLWRAHPWLGVGGGNYELELPRAGVIDAQTHANSLYLQSLAEGGVVLFAATVGTLLAAVAILRAYAARVPYALAALGATLALALHQVFDLLVFFPKVGGLWWIVLGLGAGAIVAEQRRRPQEAGSERRAA
jgi:putative inorganic carbon (HCO3(-)) transporter